MSAVPAAMPQGGAAQVAPKARGKALRVVMLCVVVLLGLLLPMAMGSSFYLGLLTQAAILAVAAVGVGFLMHHCGLVMFGVAGVSGGATYLVALSSMAWGWNAPASAVFGLLGTTMAFALVGALIVRARPLPFAMLTLALAQMLRQLVSITGLRHITGGDDGISISFNGSVFGMTQAELAQPSVFWPVVWLALCGSMLLAWRVSRSRLGLVLRAIRANEERMRFSGFNTYLPRLGAFVLAGFIIALAGVLTALHSAFASPELLDFGTGGNTLVATIIGGAGNVFGPVLGSLLFALGQDRFGASGHLELFTGIAVVVVIAAFPDGLIGFVRNLWSRKRDARD
ncbi:branched-chain amino acid ABC transporter permease [Variovorax sp. Sphag1AA]|uniref:branched-chain amino acid ABC transporter permease n=1 Tax=Variovorax sp. Sphag1AA TaxID=2587027 RepID=UPI00161CBC1E|nr:branched-chain amino acid ABC transporter permease [Variovorax sp. Sphag1AA]MBB3181344.1 branched-chain amino acid transport system permease protein [Variovorax sp. Sphag1AA]